MKSARLGWSRYSGLKWGPNGADSILPCANAPPCYFFRPWQLPERDLALSQ